MGFFGRCLFEQIIKNANRAGILKLDAEMAAKDVAYAVAGAIYCDDHTQIKWVREHLPRLMDGPFPCVVLKVVNKQYFLVIPNYRKAQYTSLGGLLSARLSKQKRKDVEEAARLGLLDLEIKPACFAYIALCEERKMVKIGSSKQVEKRIRSLQDGLQTPLTLLAKFEGGRSKERSLHREFKLHRLDGEWFEAEPVISALKLDLPIAETA